MVKSLSPALAKPRPAKAIPARRSTDRSSIRAVAIGGGTGLSHPDCAGSARLCRIAPPVSGRVRLAPCLISDLAAVVTVTDDGARAGGCAVALTCCHRAICAIAWWLFPKTSI